MEKNCRRVYTEATVIRLRKERDALRAEMERLSALLADWHSQSVRKNGLRIQSPGHAHSKSGEWDSDNGEFAGVECAQCKLWSEAASIDSARKAAE